MNGVDDPLWEFRWQGLSGAGTSVVATRPPFRFGASVSSLSDGTLLLVILGQAVLGAGCRRWSVVGCGGPPPRLVEALHLAQDGRVLARRADFRDHDTLGVGERDGAAGVVVRDETPGDGLTLLPVTGGERPFGALSPAAPRPCGPAGSPRALFHSSEWSTTVPIRFEGSPDDPPIIPTQWTFELDPSAPTPPLCLRQVIAHARVIDTRGQVSRRLLWVDARDGRLTATLDTGTRYLPVPITFTTAPAASPPPPAARSSWAASARPSRSSSLLPR